MCFAAPMARAASTSRKGISGDPRRVATLHQGREKRSRSRRRTAQMLMVIPPWVEANAKHVSLLPPSWGTLYAIGKLDPDSRCSRAAKAALAPAFRLAGISGATKHRWRPIDRHPDRELSARLSAARWAHLVQATVGHSDLRVTSKQREAPAEQQ